MSRFELYSPEGLRVDGRRYNELKSFECSINTHSHSSDGSAFVCQGNTKILCVITGPTDHLVTNTGSIQTSNNEPVINITINQPPYATTDRKKVAKTERRISEMSIILKRSLQQLIVKKKYQRTIIDVHLTILQLDGGLLSTCINAITLALIDAGIEMYEFLTAINVALYDNVPLLDTNNLEESDLSFLTIGIIGDNNSEKINLLLMENKIPMDKLTKLIELGIEGCHRIRELMDNAVRNIGEDLMLKNN